MTPRETAASAKERSMTQPVNSATINPPTDVHPFSAIRHTGLLWLINATVFHPRGYALAIHYAEGANHDTDEPVGWTLMGDGTESWCFRDPDDPPEGYVSIDELFARTKALMP